MIIMHTMIITLAAVIVSTAAIAEPQRRSFYNDRGQEVGRATTRGNTTTFYNDRGQATGRAERRSDGATIFYDAMGRQIGTSRGGR